MQLRNVAYAALAVVAGFVTFVVTKSIATVHQAVDLTAETAASNDASSYATAQAAVFGFIVGIIVLKFAIDENADRRERTIQRRRAARK